MTSAYRPPTMRGDGTPSGQGNGNAGNGNIAAGIKRPPLNDVSNQPQHHVTTLTSDGADAKRQRLSAQGAGNGMNVENLNVTAALQPPGGAATGGV